MAEHLTSAMKRATMMGAVCLLAFGAVSAVGQTDPTRPPDVSPAVPAGEGDQSTRAMVVTSILISKRRTEAVVGDRLVHVGDRIGNAQIINISESEVTLRDEHGLHALKLFPGIEKRIIAAGADSGAATTRNSQVKSKR
jgi:MSHA biogenesis protein MshK